MIRYDSSIWKLLTTSGNGNGSAISPKNGLILPDVPYPLVHAIPVVVVVVVAGRGVLLNPPDLLPVCLARMVRFPLARPVVIIRVGTGVLVPEVGHHFIVWVLVVSLRLLDDWPRLVPVDGVVVVVVHLVVGVGVGGAAVEVLLNFLLLSTSMTV